MLAITFVLLALFLRALIAPLYLLAASVLSLLATLGVTVWIFQHRLGYDGLMYYVPFTLAVLLISRSRLQRVRGRPNLGGSAAQAAS